MSLPTGLLEQAEHLSRRELKKPRQASLRRATSSAYYALFHLLTGDAASVLGPQLSPSARAQLQRCFNHAQIKEVCAKLQQTNLPRNIETLIGSPVSASLKSVALAFIVLQDARHSADYDLNSRWNRARARQSVEKARDAFALWKTIRKTSEANVFLLSFLLYKTLESSR
jgi:uncharacterized protein (UPF0332 family)